MNNVTNGNRKHIAIFGNVNVGKSSLMNYLTGQEVSIVSSKRGTTTDSVKKAMEILGTGAILLTDTAGINDNTVLGIKRVEKAIETLKSTDLAIYVIDSSDLDLESFAKWRIEAKKYNVKFKVVISKSDLLNEEDKKQIEKNIKGSIFISVKNKSGIEDLLDEINKALKEDEDKSLIGDLLEQGSTVVLVVPIDSEAPKGRLILPQVQLIRDCLDNGIKSYVVRDTELEEALTDLKKVDLVVTDSQAFKKVSQIVPKDIKLTSFSILFARQKGDLDKFIEGASALKNLKVGSKVLIAESCTHNSSHEDIGKVKIPRMLEKYVGGKLNFSFSMGNDFKDNIEDFDLVIHCGACMINRKTVINRINLCDEKSVPITNYGIVIAFLTGILDRAVKSL
ncbi:[FeFe] hydrogenase H-cluster maturation GTPase HydF [uncultured Clostridium sp.]|uniref:[FeFe] hydrogenase H-cluster maturation GTPase HydF n=1 Tax=uncultured Clostridium sp. TaxID=59620 RepID=UPI00263338F8|nr:[FeFe] hydrogenase H-cluster maturation GTPase HydF [uncultured Clostridium sp.]